MNHPTFLEVRDVRKHYGAIKAVDGVSFKVGPGEIVGVIGPNGSGKTTLFNAILGQIRPTAGGVEFCGEDITGMSPLELSRRGVGRTFQTLQVFGQLSVRDNLIVAAQEFKGTLPGRLFASPDAGLGHRADEMIELFRLKHVAHLPAGGEKCTAHRNDNMSCIACHSAWNPSCFGCHLPQRANKKMPALHNEGDVQRNYVAYNFQTLRDDVYMLARDGDVTGNRINPARSSCAIHVGSYNQNRDSIYSQQQTISSDGLSGLAFSTNVPHTVRGGPPRDKAGNIIWDHVKHAGRSETKSCTDCHLSAKGDNNAILAQLTMQGTGYTNFMGRYCWVAAGEHGLFGVVVTEQDEPQTVIGSSLHRLAFPDCFKKHVERGFRLKDAHEHPGIDIKDKLRHPRAKAEILAVQNRGEYLYAACGHDGVRVFDIAMIDNKSFSERITTAPVAPRGQIRSPVRRLIPAPIATSWTRIRPTSQPTGLIRLKRTRTTKEKAAWPAAKETARIA